MKKIFVVLVFICVLLVGCNSQNDLSELLDTTTPAPENIGNPNIQNESETVQPQYQVSIGEERTAWNIELTVTKQTDDYLNIYILDHDNQGFYFTPWFYNLERLIDGQWVAITNHKKNEMVKQGIMYSIPRPEIGYAESMAVVDFNSLYDRSILVPGKYQAILYLSDREYRVEFELD